MRITPLSSEQVDQRECGFEFGNFRMEPDGTLFRHDVPVHLTPKELAALRYLLQHAGQLVTPEQLKQALWGGIHVTDDSVPRCLSSLRARLGADPCIETVYKRGYRMKCAVRRLDPAQPAPLPRLALMPFACGSGVEPHLGAAISEEAAARLTAVDPPIASVMARDSVFSLAAKGLTAQEIGQTLKADLVLTGTLLTWATHFRLRVEMIRVRDSIQIWTEDLLVRRDDAGELEAQLLERLAFRLGSSLPLSIAAAGQTEPRPAGDSRAYELYLRGHSEWQSLERHRMRDATELLQKAIEINPALLAARIDLVHAAITQSLYGFLSPQRAAEEARRAADTIPDLPRNAPSVLPALGWTMFHVEHRLPAALRLFESAAHLPHDPWTTRMRVMFALSRHRFDESLDVLSGAMQNDPLAPWLHARLAWTLHLAGRAWESKEQTEYCLVAFPRHESTNFYGAQILAFNGEAERAQDLAHELVQRSPYFDLASAVEAYTLARSGNRAAAQDILERLQWLARERFVLRSFLPMVYAALGDAESALSELEASQAARCPWFFQLLADPRLKDLHGHPRFQRMADTLHEMESEVRS